MAPSGPRGRMWPRCIGAWQHGEGNAGRSSPSPTPLWSVSFICSPAMNPTVNWGPTILMSDGGITRSTGCYHALSTWAIGCISKLRHIDFLDAQIAALNSAIEGCVRTLSQEVVAGPTPHVPTPADVPAPPEPLPPLTFTRAVELLDTIPGVNQQGAEMILAEIGIDMTRFGTASRLAAWSGVAPGNDESAGKQRSGKTRKGHQVLRAGLTQLAHGAVRTKGTYVSALYRRLAARRGKRRA